LKSEVALLKGVIEEGDRSRELLMRELARQREEEEARRREETQKREAQMKIGEREKNAMSRDKKEAEGKVEELLKKQEKMEQKFREQHHHTVKYFEGQIVQLQAQINKYGVGDKVM